MYHSIYHGKKKHFFGCTHPNLLNGQTAAVFALDINAIMPRRRKTLREQYEPYLRKFMQWKGGRNYAKNTQFTDAQLLEIRPNQLVRFMCLLAYGVEVPGDNDRPTNRRASGLAFAKKALSYFMPNKNMQWNVETQAGNPTMSVAVNDLIKRIRREEVRKSTFMCHPIDRANQGCFHLSHQHTKRASREVEDTQRQTHRSNGKKHLSKRSKTAL